MKSAERHSGTGSKATGFRMKTTNRFSSEMSTVYSSAEDSIVSQGLLQLLRNKSHCFQWDSFLQKYVWNCSARVVSHFGLHPKSSAMFYAVSALKRPPTGWNASAEPSHVALRAAIRNKVQPPKLAYEPLWVLAFILYQSLISFKMNAIKQVQMDES